MKIHVDNKSYAKNSDIPANSFIAFEPLDNRNPVTFHLRRISVPVVVFDFLGFLMVGLKEEKISMELLENVMILMENHTDDRRYATCRQIVTQLQTRPRQAAIFPASGAAWTLERRQKDYQLLCMEMDAIYTLETIAKDPNGGRARRSKFSIATTRQNVTVTPITVKKIFLRFFPTKFFFFKLNFRNPRSWSMAILCKARKQFARRTSV